jgi:hypothetical protein
MGIRRICADGSFHLISLVNEDEFERRGQQAASFLWETEMVDDVRSARDDSIGLLQQAASSEELEVWYRSTLGRKGRVTLLTRQVGQLSPEERPEFGRQVNVVKKM